MSEEIYFGIGVHPSYAKKEQIINIALSPKYDAQSFTSQEMIIKQLKAIETISLQSFVDIEMNTGHTPLLIDAIEKLAKGKIDLRRHMRRFAEKRQYVNSSQVTVFPDVVSPTDAQKIHSSDKKNIDEFYVRDLDGNSKIALMFMANLYPGNVFVQRFGFTRSFLENGARVARPFLFLDRQVETYLSHNLSEEDKASIETLLAKIATDHTHDFLGHSVIDMYLRLGDETGKQNYLTKRFLQMLTNSPPLIPLKEGMFNPSNYEILLAILTRQAWEQAMEDTPGLEKELIDNFQSFRMLVEKATEGKSENPPTEKDESVKTYLLQTYVKYLMFILPPEHEVFQSLSETYPWMKTINSRFHKYIHKHDGISFYGREVPAIDMLIRFIDLCDQVDALPNNSLIKTWGTLMPREQVLQEDKLHAEANKNSSMQLLIIKPDVVSPYLKKNTSPPSIDTDIYTYELASRTFDPWVRKQIIQSSIHQAEKYNITPKILHTVDTYTQNDLFEACILASISNLIEYGHIKLEQASEVYKKGIHRVYKNKKLFAFWYSPEVILKTTTAEKNNATRTSVNSFLQFVHLFQ